MLQYLQVMCEDRHKRIGIGTQSAQYVAQMEAERVVPGRVDQLDGALNDLSQGKYKLGERFCSCRRAKKMCPQMARMHKLPIVDSLENIKISVFNLVK